MNTELTTVQELDLAAQLLDASAIRDPEDALGYAFATVMKAAGQWLYKRALNGRTKDELSDEEFDNLPQGADDTAIIRVLVEQNSVEEVCNWAKAVGAEDGLFGEKLGELMKAAADAEDDED